MKIRHQTEDLQRFVRGATTHDYGKSGIAGESLIRECPINTVISKIQSSFDESVDGEEAEPVLVVPVIDVKHSAKWAVCLRGKNHLSVFSTEDEERLSIVAPYLVNSLDNAIRLSDAIAGQSKNAEEHQCITSLGTVSSEISKGSPIPEIVRYVIESLKTLVHATRVYYFQMDSSTNTFKSLLQLIVKIRLYYPRITES